MVMMRKKSERHSYWSCSHSTRIFYVPIVMCHLSLCLSPPQSSTGSRRVPRLGALRKEQRAVGLRQRGAGGVPV